MVYNVKKEDPYPSSLLKDPLCKSVFNKLYNPLDDHFDKWDFINHLYS